MPDEFNKFIIISAYGEGLSLAHHLKMEGKEVLVGLCVDMTMAMEKHKEEPEAKAARWSQYSGILDKMPIENLLAHMEKFEDKEEWFVIFDFNTLYKYADQAKKMGFTNGLFPSKLDYLMEADREFAKQFVMQNYPGVKVAEVEQFKTVEEGIEFINESDEFWALKGNDAGATTVVPSAKKIENARAELIDALQGNKEDYQRKGYILERQIRDGIEVCPQLIFYNGKRVATCIDIEDKNFSCTDGSDKFGCAINLIVATPMDCELNKIAFPEATDKLAKKHPGLYYIDANLILKDGEFYYLEFCSGRMGFDAVFGEAEMAGSVSDYFNALAHGENPYEKKFGAGSRGFMMKREDDGLIKEGISARFGGEIADHLWFFGIQQGNGKFTNTKGSFGDSHNGIDLLAFTESSDDCDFAMLKLNELISNFSFNGLYARKDIATLYGRLQGIEKFITPEVAGGAKD